MGHHHSHHHAQGKNIGIAILLNVCISILQLIGGLISGSISLLSDAAHNFSDVFSLLLSYFTHRLSHQAANDNYTFGYGRAEILSALFNSMTLIVIAILLLFEASGRVHHPAIIEANIVIYFAFASIVINVLSVLLLHRDAKHSLNIRASYLHLLTDVLTSLAVMVGGIVMKYMDFYLIDSILSILIAIYLIWSSYPIIRKTLCVLMHRTPQNLNIESIKQQILYIDDIHDLERIHLWQLNENENYFEAHIILKKDLSVKDFEVVSQKISNLLHAEGIENISLIPAVRK
jgi:cobalt-zinc-cadmium efflux system protein